jgi:hypothetical protein
MKKAIAALALAALAGCATAQSTPEDRGTRPTYLGTITQSVPNGEALRDHIFVPGLDEGYVPQGLTAAGPHLYVSSYKPSPDIKSSTGPCRVYRIEAATGKPAGQFDMPVGVCTHAGGLAWLGNGRLFIADTRQVFLIDAEKALASGKGEGAMKGVRITGELRGSYGTFDGKDAWIGTWTKEQAKARMFRLDPRLFDDFDGQTVKEDRAVESIPVPLEAQGAAFDKAGNLWVSASGPKFGKLYRLDRKGAIQAQYDMVAGLEDLAVDDAGNLWGLSESGTLKYMHWDTHYPYIFRIDTAKLK